MMAGKQVQTIIVGCMVITVANAMVSNLTSSTTKGPAARIVIGGWVLTVGLLLASEAQPEIAEAFAILITMATLFGPNGEALVKLISSGNVLGSINVKHGAANSSSIPNSSPGGSLASTVSGVGDSLVGDARAVALKARTIKPDLVAVAGGFKLDKSAAAAYNKAVEYYGKPIPIGNSFRTYEQQAAAYEASGGASGTFGTPGKSLHEVGLAVDLGQTSMFDDPLLIAAMDKAGWFRAGKKVKVNGVLRPEPWHWSYGVKG